MTKTYVLDTNVLLHHAEALFAFKENDVVIPIAVIEERLKGEEVAGHVTLTKGERSKVAELGARLL